MSADENSAYKSSVPKRYKKIDIKLGKMGVDDFDFDSYNKVVANFVEFKLLSKGNDVAKFVSVQISNFFYQKLQYTGTCS